MYTSLPFKNGSKTVVLKVHISLGRFSSDYKVTLEVVSKAASAAESSDTTSKTWCIGKFFTAEGYLDEMGCREAMEEYTKAFLSSLKKKGE